MGIMPDWYYAICLSWIYYVDTHVVMLSFVILHPFTKFLANNRPPSLPFPMYSLSSVIYMRGGSLSILIALLSVEFVC